MESLRAKIQLILIERAPNSLTLNNFAGLIRDEDFQSIQRELGEMVAARLVVERSQGLSKDYMLPSYAGIPPREFISIGGVKVPRLLHGDTARPEDLNIFFEVLGKRILLAESEADRKLDERLKGYWGNIVTLFGAFIGVFSLIVTFVKTAPIDGNATFLSVFAVTSAQVLPLAFVLGMFVWFLKSQFK
jgi:hypothetical protein